MNVIEEKYDWAYALTPRKTTTLLVLHHEAGSGTTAQQIHNYHKNVNKWAGIAYHYYVRKDGSVYRGRPENMIGGHCLNYNYCSIGICFEGNFENEQMGQAQIDAGWELIADILRRYPGISVRRHKDLNATACPGRNFPFDVLTGKYNPTKENKGMTEEDVRAIIAKVDAENKTTPPSKEETAAAQKAKARGYMDGTRLCYPVTRGELAIILDRIGVLE